MNDILKRIFDELDRQSITASDLCKETGIASSTFFTWKTKNKAPSTEALAKISDYLNVSIDYLVKGENEDGYYFDPEVAEMAQEMATRPELKVLFSASRKVSKESIEAINNMIEQMKKD